jgi:dihydrodipicolinate synthase/N-acetylneuraminate lyase
MQKELLNLRGIITVLNTPFTDTLEVDLLALRLNVQKALKAGVAGFLIPALASEVDRLRDEEKTHMVQTVLEEVKGKVPVIGGTSALKQENRLKLAHHMVDMGCEGILVNIPYESEAQFHRDVAEIAKVDPKFLMLQDWAFQSYGLPLQLIVSLFQEIACFRALKVEVVPAGIKYTEVIEATNGQLHVSGGWAVMQMIEAMDRGVHAFMPTAMHPIYTAIHRHYINGNRAKAVQIFNRLLPVLAFSNQHLDISIHFFKRLLWRQQLYSTPNVRQPILPFDRFHQKIADQLIELVLELEADPLVHA